MGCCLLIAKENPRLESQRRKIIECNILLSVGRKSYLPAVSGNMCADCDRKIPSPNAKEEKKIQHVSYIHT